MRISTQMMYQQQMQGITNSQSKWLSYGEQMTTGQRVNRPSDDPIAASQAVVLSQAQSQNSQFALARSFATTKVSLEESVLGQVTTALQSAQEKIVYAGNGTLTDNDRASLATDLKGLRDQLMNLANSTDGNGRYIFAGYNTEAPAFDGTTGDYEGGNTAISQQVDAARNMDVSHIGSDVFAKFTSNAVKEPDGSTGEANLFKILDTAIAALNDPVGDDATKSAALKDSIDYYRLKTAGMDIVTDFPPIRIWGTIGFIMAMWAVSFSGFELSHMQLYIGAALSVVLVLFTLTLPHIPVSNQQKKQSWSSMLGLDAFALFKNKRMAIFFIFSMLLGAELQITNMFGNTFLHSFDNDPLFSGSFIVEHASVMMSISQISETLFILTIPFFLSRYGIKNVPAI
jgi:flagellar hook-associated protein 3 FlgL